ncbi:MAG TPA: hypothetical protein VI074_08760 [Propionibacteriaceae bacterium]
MTLVAPFLTLGSRRTGSGVGADVGTGRVEAAALGCWELDPAGSFGVPAQAARVVASKTAAAPPQSLRILLLGINTPTWSPGLTVNNTAGAPAA